MKRWTALQNTLLAIIVLSAVDTGRKLNEHKTFRRRPGRFLNALCTFNLRPVSTGFLTFSARDCFNAFDFLGEGYVTANDIKEALMHIMEKSSEQDKSNILKYFKYVVRFVLNIIVKSSHGSLDDVKCNSLSVLA